MHIEPDAENELEADDLGDHAHAQQGDRRLRSAVRRGRLLDDIERESQTFENFDDRSSFDTLASEDTGKQVREAIQKLSKDQREALNSRFPPQIEVAGRLKEPLGMIKAADPARNDATEGNPQARIVASAYAAARSVSSRSRATSQSG